MEMNVKKVDHIVISLNPEEAEKLKALLNISHDGTSGHGNGVMLEKFSWELWEELDELDVKDIC